MYSVVMMMVLSSTPDAVAFGGRSCHGGHGCSGAGCSGYVVSSGCGGHSAGCSGCGGYSAGCGGCHGGLFHRHGGRGCHGCSGSVSYGCGGGVSHGCGGGGVSHGCSGSVSYGCGGGVSHGCGGGVSYGCTGGGCTGGMGCTGGGCTGGMGCAGGVSMGCTGGMGCAGGHVMGTTSSGTMMAAAPATAAATIVVTLPADAKLAFDGVATTSTAEVRSFATPALAAGVNHSYTLSAEIVKDGKKLTASQSVTVKAGETTQVKLTADSFSTAVASR